MKQNAYPSDNSSIKVVRVDPVRHVVDVKRRENFERRDVTSHCCPFERSMHATYARIKLKNLQITFVAAFLNLCGRCRLPHQAAKGVSPASFARSR
jgi:hypothetical protein